MSKESNPKKSQEIQITYCVEWGYLERGSSLAAEIKKEFDIEVNLKEGHGGIFEVAKGDQVIYSNLKECGRLPEKEEIFAKIRE